MAIADEKFTLAPQTIVEPLVSRWHAWPYLIAPATASFYASKYQLKLLESFIADPNLHQEAAMEPSLGSGAFAQLSATDVDRVRELYSSMQRDYKSNCQFTEEYFAFNRRLNEEADGMSLLAWYGNLPKSLQGLVELCYDYSHRPHTRVLEPLAYQSILYREDCQSIRLFNLENDSDRAFFMNTPRLLGGEGSHDISQPFKSPLVRAIAALDTTPQKFSALVDLFGGDEASTLRLMPYLARAIPRGQNSRSSYEYLGHASVLISWNGVSILTDPIISAKPSSVSHDDRYTFADLPDRIDYILITHAHHDHFDVETLLRLSKRTEILVVPHSNSFFVGDISLRLIAKELGFKNVIELDSFDTIKLQDGEITALPFLGEHADLPHSRNAYSVRLGTETSIFAADSDCLDPAIYGSIRRELGQVRNLFLGTEHVGAPLTWNYGPLLSIRPTMRQNESRRINGANEARALEIIAQLRPEHFYCYAMGIEPWTRYLLGAEMGVHTPSMSAAPKIVEGAKRFCTHSRLLSGVQALH